MIVAGPVAVVALAVCVWALVVEQLVAPFDWPVAPPAPTGSGARGRTEPPTGPERP